MPEQGHDYTGKAKGDVKDMGDKSKQTGQSAQEKAKGSMGDARSRMQQGMKSGEDMSKHAYEKAGEGVDKLKESMHMGGGNK